MRPPAITDVSLQWEISDALFDKYRDLIYREAGIALTEGKKSLLVSRVAGRLRELGVSSFEDYFRLVEDPASTDERGRLLDRICTNETHFFRDPRQFLFLNDTLFPRIEAEAGRVRQTAYPCLERGVLHRRGAVLDRHGDAPPVPPLVRLASRDRRVRSLEQGARLGARAACGRSTRPETSRCTTARRSCCAGPAARPAR